MLPSTFAAGLLKLNSVSRSTNVVVTPDAVSTEAVIVATPTAAAELSEALILPGPSVINAHVARIGKNRYDLGTLSMNQIAKLLGNTDQQNYAAVIPSDNDYGCWRRG